MLTIAVRLALVVAALMVPCAGALAQTKSLADMGIVLMHGKGGQPGGLIGSLAETLRGEGAAVDMPRMAWSGKQGQPDKYEMTYEEALAEVGRSIAGLRARGARRIVVAGQSLGANAAIGFAARHGQGLAAIVAIAPGHTPERMRHPDIVAGVESARQMVAAGKTAAATMFSDTNQGQSLRIRATPRAYLSFFDPRGPAVMPRNAAAMPPLPFLWVIGGRDPLAAAGSGYAFDKAPKHPKSRYLEVNADHRGTPDVARGQIVSWLKSL